METSKIQNIVFFSTLALVSILFLYILKPFFFPIFWAAVIAIVFKPLYHRLNRKLNPPSLSATLVMLIIALIIILPGGIIGSLLFSESVDMYHSLSQTTGSGIDESIRKVAGVVKNNPHLAKLNVDEAFLTAKAAEIARGISNYILVQLTNLTQNTVLFVVQFAVMLYTLFFFIRDGDRFTKMAMKRLTFGQNREKILYDRFVSTARATLKVTLIIGGIQGTLGGIIFLITGVQGALTWGIVMVFSAIVPVVGCSIVWAPAGVIMLLTGHVWEGILILCSGVLLISTVDNFLRPVLLGKDTQMHPLMVFLSTLGGLSLFGFSGFVIGPIIASLLLALWAMYGQFYQETLS